MTDDLVKRLREGCVTGNYEGLEFIEPSKTNATMNEAANRIEQLEAALRKAKVGLSAALLWSDDDGTWVAYETVVKAHEIARAALEGKDD